jgi:hypothetical protein
MLQIHSEKNTFPFNGTIIDIESIGDFCHGYCDSREYKDIIPTVFGYINDSELNILCANGHSALEELREEIITIMPTLRKPLFAFQCDFERGVLFHSCGIKIEFHGELNTEKFEAKRNAIRLLRISNYDDPFYDSGYECMKAWLRGDYENAIKHNRSCLLKERDILLKRKHRKPDELVLYPLSKD